MPRRPRMYVPGFPYHLVQRGNDRKPCFFDSADRERYLDLLCKAMAMYGVSLHAYVLMTNHIHLLLTPQEPDSISRMTRVTGSRYAQYINKRYQRTGTLWEGRHKSSLIDSQIYLLRCYRYIEMNPVRAGMVPRPGDYRWSSYAANISGAPCAILTPHTAYLGLGASEAERGAAYRQIVDEALDEQTLQAIRSATHYCQPLGSERFLKFLENELGIPLGRQARGRPRKCD